MAEEGRRRRSDRNGGRTFRFLSSQGKDGDWIAELRDDFPEVNTPGEPVNPPKAPVLFDRLADEDPPPSTELPAEPSTELPAEEPVGSAEADEPAGDPWVAFGEVLDAQQASLLALAERLDAVEARLAEVLRGAPSSGPDAHPEEVGVREVVDAVRATAAGSAARLGREVARRRKG